MSRATLHSRAPGPSYLEILRRFLFKRQSYIDHLVDLAETYGDTFVLPLAHPTFFIRHPDDIKHLLISNPLNYHKTGGPITAGDLLGDGLVSSEEPLHGKQRKLMQPMFHKGSISNFADIMVNCTERQMAGWKDGETLDLALEMMHLTISIAGLTLFSVDLYREGKSLGIEFATVMRLVMQRQMTPPQLLRWLPVDKAYSESLAKIDEAIGKIISDHQALPEDQRPDDLLAMILASKYEDGSTIPDKLVRDEVITIILAGHETVANHMNWTFYRMSRHPEVLEKMRREWDEVLGDRMPGIQDMGRLPYTTMVLAESMRLYPPAWTLARRALKEDQLPSGLKICPGDEILMTQYISHRNPAYFPEPATFDPERFAPGRRESIPKFAYYPFGMGSRVCIGESFARLEAIIMVVMIGRRFDFEQVRKGPAKIEALITLRPKKGMPVIAHLRPARTIP
jgi:cytochrome P450